MFSKRNIKILAIILLIFAAGLFVWAFIVEPRLLVVKNERIDLENWHKEHNGLRVLVMSDFHLGFFHMTRNRLIKIVEKCNEQKPDLILLLGDYVDKLDKNDKAVKFLGELKKLKSPLGIYAVFGNHEGWYNRFKIRKAFKEANIKILDNSSAKIRLNNKDFWLAGIDDYITGKPDLKKALSSVNNNPIVFLSHNPIVIKRIPEKVSLTIAGHTHGGQVFLPAIAMQVIPSRFPSTFTYPTGFSLKDGKPLFITSGLGTTILPARFLVQPEIVVLEIE